MPQITTLCSGSSGNCVLVRSEKTTLIVDMGQSCRRTLSALKDLGVFPQDIDAILITHEHSDHVGGLNTFLKHYQVPLYVSGSSASVMKKDHIIPENADIYTVECGDLIIGDITVHPFHTSHDSADCLAYCFSFPCGSRAAVVTDTGYLSDDMLNEILGCGVVCLESNYDNNMLLAGPYPYYLKSRIRSRNGHLCNDDCAAAAVKLVESGTQTLVLVHLSAENNMPAIARMTVETALENNGYSCKCRVIPAPRFEPGETVIFGE